MRLTFKDDNGKEITIGQKPPSALNGDYVYTFTTLMEDMVRACDLDGELEVRRR